MSLINKRRVLVLNRSWCAVGVVSLKRAMVMLFSSHNDGTPKAQIIDPSESFRTYTWEDWSKLKVRAEEQGMAGPRCIFRIPEVILLSRYDKLPQHKVNFSRRTVYKRDHHQCMYCGAKPKMEELSIDHVIPRSQGGKSVWDNVVLACTACNSKKANRTPEQAGMKFFIPGYKPTKPKFNLFRSDILIDSWRSFLDNAYWDVTLENDN